jgi:hypothetical protein
MDWLSLACTLWGLSLLVFHLNPLNDPIEPSSEMNRYHPLNVRIRQKVEEELANEGDERLVVIEWADIAPWYTAAWVTLLCLGLCLAFTIAA